MNQKELLHKLDIINTQLQTIRRYNQDDMALYDIDRNLKKLIKELEVVESEEESSTNETNLFERYNKMFEQDQFLAQVIKNLRKLGVRDI